jgi:hypothetical protein
MNLYKLLLDIFPHLISIRKLQNYLSIDVEFPKTWKIPKRYVDEKTILEQPSAKDDFRCFSFAVEFNEESMEKLFNNIIGIVKYNREREEKENLFELKIKELKTLFDQSKLNDLKNLEFNIRNEFDLKLEDDEQSENEKDIKLVSE